MIWDGNYYFVKKQGLWYVNNEMQSTYSAAIATKKQLETYVIQAPHGAYCEKCLRRQLDTNGNISFQDGDKLKFWSQCKECKLRKERSTSAKKWTEVLRSIDPELNHCRLATFTIKNPRYKMQDIFDPLKFSYDFSEAEASENFVKKNSRKTYDGYQKYTGDIKQNMKILEITREYRKELLTRFKNLRSYKR